MMNSTTSHRHKHSHSDSLLSHGLLRGIVATLAILLGLAAAFYAVENWRGKRAWQSFRRQWEAAGGKLSFQAVIPAPVPDEQNAAMTPLFKSLLDYGPGEPLGPDWQNKNARVLALRLGRTRANGSLGHPAVGDWRVGQRTDFSLWRGHFTTTAPGAKDAAAQADGPNSAAAMSPVKQTAAAADVLNGLAAFDPDLDELRTAVRRPSARYPIHYEDMASALLPHLSQLNMIAEVLQLRALAELQLDRGDAALADVMLILRLANTLRGESLPVSQQVRAEIALVGLEPIWEGMMGHRWSDAQLSSLETELSRLDFVGSFANALKSDVAFINELLLSHRPLLEENRSLSAAQEIAYLRWAPQGWAYQNSVFACQFLRDKVLSALDPVAARVNPRSVDAATVWLQTAPLTAYSLQGRGFLARPLKELAQVTYAQSAVNLARVACALERHRLSAGQYPEKLDALVPRFSRALPHDIMNGEPLKYRRTDDAQAVLYSVGWNQTDDGGQPARINRSDDGQRDSDWVWKMGP